MVVKNTNQNTTKALDARKKALKGNQTQKTRKVRTQVHFYRPKTYA